MHRLLIGSLISLSVAQDAQAQRWTGAIKLGGTSTTFTGDLAAGETIWNRRTGFAAGAAMGLQLRYGFSPMAEVTYVRMGAATPVIFLDVPATLRSDLTYLMTALLLQYRLYTGGYVNPRAFAGPAYLYSAGATVTVAARDGLGVLTEQDDSVEGTDYGFVFGGGLDMEIGSQILTLEMRYYQGQRDVTKPNEELGESTLQNAGFIIMVGILF